ncbi:PA14 domain-containing protein [Neolewinella agarilytica]|uniref:Cytochrome c n=1 Tax=Neolewinella agarilytica TaxID=478744 RepID=A0A1H9P3I3_9BACT|nr:PA14 domain-containing protein [Neolewinella agarilytica]SER42627.1 cytochrome c [Neolewinella agarilytica]
MQNHFLLFSRLSALLSCLIILGGCQQTEFPTHERALSPWVFRSVLDDQPRMLTAALHKDLFVAYSAETGALYKAWKGDVDLDGAVYTTAHGPQPEAIGKVWLKDTMAQHWLLYQQGNMSPVRPDVQYLGHEIKDGQLYIKSKLMATDGSFNVTVTERPEVILRENGLMGLERTFFVEGVPENSSLALRCVIDGIPTSKSISTNARFEVMEQQDVRTSNLRALSIYGVLTMATDQPTYLRTHFVRSPTLPDDNADAGAILADAREAGEKLIERNGCKTCHNTRVKTIGPAYMAIAERYPNTTASLEKLSAKVIKGGAGVWGKAAMTAHDHIPPSDIRTMVQWVLDLDKDSEAEMVAEDPGILFASKTDALEADPAITDDGLGAGARAEVFPVPDGISRLEQVAWEKEPLFTGVVPRIRFDGADFGKLEDLFAIRFSGYLKIPETSNYLFRLASDDGSRLIIDGQEIVNADGLHGPEARDGEIALAAGNHPFTIEYFENGGGQTVIFEWRSFFSPEWQTVPTENLGYDLRQNLVAELPEPMDRGKIRPGDATRLTDVHPAYTLRQARPDGFTPKVGGMDFLSDGRLVVSTWDAEGAVYLIDGVQTGEPSQMTTKKIATGLAEPLGLKVVDDEIYIMQKQELTRLIDHDGDELIDEYQTVCNDWETTANFHEFGFGLAYEAPYFYATLAIGILPGGASAPNQPRSRGKCVRIHRETGELEYIASGLRTPNGINQGVDGELFIADNQGDWLPASKILHVTEGAFFNSYAVPGEENKTVKPPVVWLPQDEIGNSPSTPNYLNDGPYKGQMIHGEITHGGLKRVFVEQVNGQYQGTVFRFIQGLEAGVNRNVWGPDGALYIGMVGSTGNWGDAGKLYYGLQSVKYNGEPAFEVLAIRTEADGFELEFTQPVAEGFGKSAAEFPLTRWYYLPTANYGGPKMDETPLTVNDIQWSADRKKVRLTFDGLKTEHVYYFRLPQEWRDTSGRQLWSTESWTTVNYVPQVSR